MVDEIVVLENPDGSTLAVVCEWCGDPIEERDRKAGRVWVDSAWGSQWCDPRVEGKSDDELARALPADVGHRPEEPKRSFIVRRDGQEVEVFAKDADEARAIVEDKGDEFEWQAIPCAPFSVAGPRPSGVDLFCGAGESGLTPGLVLANVRPIPELLPDDEVTLALDATVYVHVTRDGVVKVVVVPDVADAGALSAEVWVHDSTNGVTDEGVVAAKKWAESNPWAPLAELPADVVWEG